MSPDLESADADLAGFQQVLQAYQAQISPQTGYSDQGIFLLIIAAVGVGALLLLNKGTP